MDENYRPGRFLLTGSVNVLTLPRCRQPSRPDGDSPDAAAGALLENFVFAEVLKLMAASDLRLTPYHFRDQQMHEVDIVLERDDGMVVGIEVKSSATVKSSDFAGLRTLAAACGDRFAYGVVLYDSAALVPFGDRLAAVPLSALWG